MRNRNRSRRFRVVPSFRPLNNQRISPRCCILLMGRLCNLTACTCLFCYRKKKKESEQARGDVCVFWGPGFQQMTWKVRCFGWNFVDFGSDFRVQVLECLATQETDRQWERAFSIVSLCVWGLFLLLMNHNVAIS